MGLHLKEGADDDLAENHEINVTPFIDVTFAAGLAISAFHPSAERRLRRPRAMNESSSLKPSKVTMATRMVTFKLSRRAAVATTTVVHESGIDAGLGVPAGHRARSSAARASTPSATVTPARA